MVPDPDVARVVLANWGLIVKFNYTEIDYHTPRNEKRRFEKISTVGVSMTFFLL